MTEDKRQIIAFDPNHPAWRHKLWVRLRTHEGVKTFIIWRRMWKALVVLALAGWLGLAGVTWAFVRFRLGITEARFVDIAFFPLRQHHYRQALALHYAKLADQDLAAGKWPDAVLSLRRAVANNPGDLATRRKLAALFLRTSRFDLALQLLEAGLPYARNDTDYLQNLFSLLLASGQTERLLTVGAGLLPEPPDDSAAHRLVVRFMAEADISLKHYDQARTLITQRQLDNTPEGQMLLARIDSEQGFDQLALIRLQQLRQRHPNNEAAIIQLVALYRKMGRMDDARQLALIRQFQHPDSPGAQIDVLNLELESGDTPSFNRDFDSFLGQFSQDDRALEMLARSLLGRRRPDLLRRIRDTAPKDSAGRPPLTLSLAVVEADCVTHDFHSAAQEAQALAAAQPNLAPGWQARLTILRCWAAYGLGDQTQGSAWLTQYLSIQDPDALNNRLILAHDIGSSAPPVAIRQLLASARQLDPQDRRALLAIATFDIEQKDWKQAASWLPDLLALNPPPPAEVLNPIWQDPQAMRTLTDEFVQTSRPDLVRQIRDHAPKDAAGRAPRYLDLAVVEADCGAGNFQSALTAAQAIAAQPQLTPAEQARVALLRCWATYGLNDQTQGVALLNQYLSLPDPDAVANRLALARHLAKLAPPDQIRELLVSAHQLSPQEYSPLLALAGFEIGRQAWPQAAQWLSALLALTPPPTADLLRDLWPQGLGDLSPAAQAQIAALRCWTTYGLGDQAQGSAWLGQYLSLPDPDGVNNRLVLAQRIEKLAPPTSIRQLLASARQLAPQERRPLLALAALDLKQHNWTGVAQWLPDALALNPPPPAGLLDAIWQDPQALETLADAFVSANRPDLLRQLRDHAPKDASGRSPLYLDLAVAEADCGSGDFAAASKEAEIIAARPDLTPADAARLAALRCWAAFGLGDQTQGANLLAQCLALQDPAALDNRLALARRIEKLAPPVSVRTVLVSARDLAPQDRRALLALAAFDIGRQDWPQAAQWLPDLLALNPPAPADLLNNLWQQGKDALPPALRAKLAAQLKQPVAPVSP